ncbi:hypothetical protein POM88_025052 [Heracleum sosnowskyi]|uniref:Transposase-associated domain-containing protein n=1 Tax=Heracleum sosnowskyi TaxID=360622 RepID=A0AAD8I415_9APIA|nr:hypothetical protein POM88_025052 [Heracleum sosnowskyi]
MDRHTWMYKISRVAREYIDGVENFIEFAEEFQKKKRMELGKEEMIMCPCRDCYNLKKYPSATTVHDHLFRRGFMNDYTKWIWHGEGIHYEKTKKSDQNYESNEDSIRTNKEDDAENDRVDEMIQDVEDLLMQQPKILENLVDDSKKLLYPGCNAQFTRSRHPVGIPRSRHERRLDGQGTLGHRMISPTVGILDRAHLFVLQHMTDVNPYLQEHITQLRKMHPSKSGKWSIVLQSKRRILIIDNVEDEEEYNQFDENPPFSIGLPSTVREDNVDANYARNDHDEGQWFDHQVFDMDEDNREESSKEVSKKRTRGPTICKKLKKRILNQNLDCTISFDDLGNPIGDMRRDFRTYV